MLSETFAPLKYGSGFKQRLAPNNRQAKKLSSDLGTCSDSKKDRMSPAAKIALSAAIGSTILGLIAIGISLARESNKQSRARPGYQGVFLRTSNLP